jgi:hypothetical protein
VRMGVDDTAAQREAAGVCSGRWQQVQWGSGGSRALQQRAPGESRKEADMRAPAKILNPK